MSLEYQLLSEDEKPSYQMSPEYAKSIRESDPNDYGPVYHCEKETISKEVGQYICRVCGHESYIPILWDKRYLPERKNKPADHEYPEYFDNIKE